MRRAERDATINSITGERTKNISKRGGVAPIAKTANGKTIKGSLSTYFHPVSISDFIDAKLKSEYKIVSKTGNRFHRPRLRDTRNIRQSVYEPVRLLLKFPEFLHVLVGRVQTMQANLFYKITPEAHRNQTVVTLMSLFDTSCPVATTEY